MNMNIHDLLTVLGLQPLQQLNIHFRDATWGGNTLTVTGGSNKYELTVNQTSQEIMFHLDTGNSATVSGFVSDINNQITGITNIGQYDVCTKQHTIKKRIGFPIHQNNNLIMPMVP